MRASLDPVTEDTYQALLDLAGYIDFDPKKFHRVFNDKQFFNDFLMALLEGAFCEYSPKKEALAMFLLTAFKTKNTRFILPRNNLFGIVYLSFASQGSGHCCSEAELELYAWLIPHAQDDFECLSLESQRLFDQFVGPMLSCTQLDQ